MMLLASEPSGGEISNPRFHALNQAIAQLVRCTVCLLWVLSPIAYGV